MTGPSTSRTSTSSRDGLANPSRPRPPHARVWQSPMTTTSPRTTTASKTAWSDLEFPTIETGEWKMQRLNLRTRHDAILFSRTARRSRMLAAAAAGLLVAARAGAADISWVGAPGVPLSFGTGANWAGGAVPDAPDDAIINNGGIATVAPAFSRTVTDLRLGADPLSSGALTQTGGTINATGNVAFGEHRTGRGTFNISGGEMNVGSGFLGNFSIGDDGAGTATISGGVINTRFAFLGRSTHGHGHVTQTGSTLAVERNLVMAELKPADLTAPQTP